MQLFRFVRLLSLCKFPVCLTISEDAMLALIMYYTDVRRTFTDRDRLKKGCGDENSGYIVWRDALQPG